MYGSSKRSLSPGRACCVCWGGIGRRFEKEMKVNGWGRLKLAEGRNPWQWVKHAWLYSDILQALKREFFLAVASQQISNGALRTLER